MYAGPFQQLPPLHINWFRSFQWDMTLEGGGYHRFILPSDDDGIKSATVLYSTYNNTTVT